MKYNLGTTQIQDSGGNWQYPKGIFVNNNGTWVPVKTGWVCKADGTWERIFPIPAGNLQANVTTLNFTTPKQQVYQNHYASAAYSISNAGDYDLVISNIAVSDSTGNYLTVSQTLSVSSLPHTLLPGESMSVQNTIFANNIGTFGGNITVSSNVGYLGNKSSTISMTVNSIPDYNGISVNTPRSLTFNLIPGVNTTTYTYNTIGTNPTYTVPAGVDYVSITMVGGGGGGGAADSHGGYGGSGGYMLSGPLSVQTGDTLVVHVGGGGAAGSSGSHNYIAPGGHSDEGFGGGNGGPSGYAGWSGSGGGGGAATTLYLNNSLVAVAAGGGGGGGGGNYSYGRPVSSSATSGGHAGGNGSDRGGGDGGGPGGGGGGYPGGAAGDIVYGDNGSYTGVSGTVKTVSGWKVSQTSNGGAPNASYGSNGYATIVEYRLATYATQTFTITNSGNGGLLSISNIHSVNGHLVSSNLTANSIGYNFNSFTGQTATFDITPYTLPIGTYTDTIRITSNAVNSPVYDVSVTINVQSHGNIAVFTVPGEYVTTVPSGIYTIGMFVVGGGGGGGGGLNTGSSTIGGGGGGSGGFVNIESISVTPGDLIVVNVGTGGAGGVGTANGSTGADSTVENQSAQWTATAEGGLGGYSSVNGAAGAAGGASGGIPGSSGGIPYGGTGGIQSETINIGGTKQQLGGPYGQPFSSYVGGTTYGPYGKGGNGGYGGSSNNNNGENGQSGGVIISWGVGSP